MMAGGAILDLDRAMWLTLLSSKLCVDKKLRYDLMLSQVIHMHQT